MSLDHDPHAGEREPAQLDRLDGLRVRRADPPTETDRLLAATGGRRRRQPKVVERPSTGRRRIAAVRVERGRSSDGICALRGGAAASRRGPTDASSVERAIDDTGSPPLMVVAVPLVLLLGLDRVAIDASVALRLHSDRLVPIVLLILSSIPRVVRTLVDWFG